MGEPATNYLHLTILNGILSDPLIALFADYRNNKSPQARMNFLRALYENNAEGNFASYVSNVVLRDDNPFSRACAASDDISPYLQKAYINDLVEIGKALAFETTDFSIGTPSAPIRSWDDKAANLLYGYYQSSGYGKFLSCSQFRYENGDLAPILTPVNVSTNDLKGFESEKADVYDNIENFVKGLPCSDMLLYGEAGTGKTSLIYAMTNLFFSQKLRLIKLSQKDIGNLPAISDMLNKIPLCFMVLVNITLDGIDQKDAETLSSVKAALCDCTLSGNMMITATIDTETVKDLSDCFGVAVCFKNNPSKFAELVREIAREKKLKYTNEELDSFSERWASVQMPSPRRAKQLVDYLVACQKKGKEAKI